MLSEGRGGAAKRTARVIDDDPLLYRFVGTALSEQGCGTLTAADAAQALSEIGRRAPALVPIDKGMSVASGRACAALVQWRAGRTVSCVIMSGGAIARDVAEDAVISA